MAEQNRPRKKTKNQPTLLFWAVCVAIVVVAVVLIIIIANSTKKSETAEEPTQQVIVNEGTDAEGEEATEETTTEEETTTQQESTTIFKVYDAPDGLSLRSGPGTDEEVLMVVPADSTVTVSAIADGWAAVKYNDDEGYMYAMYLSPQGYYESEKPMSNLPETPYEVTGGEEDTELRIAPTDETATFGAVPTGTIVAVTGIQEGWSYITYNGNAGWIKNEAITKIEIETEPAVEEDAESEI